MVVLRYRPDGALIRKTVTCGGAPSPCAASDRRYFYSGLQLMEVHDLQASRLIARYYYADDEVPLAADLWDAGAQALQPYAFLTDHAGSVIGLVDDQGQRVERIRYDTFGRPVVEAKDAAAPQVAQVLYDGNDVHVVFTEPVFAPVDELVPQAGITEKLVELEYLLQWWDHTNTPLAGTWAFDTDVPGTEANTTLTFTPSAPLDTTKTHTLHIPPGALQDDWANDAALTLALPAPSAGNYTGPAAGSTAQPRLGRSTTPNELFFQSHLWVADAGLYHMKARAYDPSTGLFLQRDPVAYVDALNLYAGFGWDPVNNRDPTGEAAEQMQRQDDLALLQGRMSKEEYRARQNARGMGAATGAVAAGGVALATQAPAIAGSVQAFGLRHPIGLSQAGCFLASLFDEGNAIECGWADDAGRRTGRLGRSAARQFENWGEGGAEAVETGFRRVEQSLPAARGAGRSLDNLSESGRLIDPADSAGQLTRAGRALQKHGNRSGTAFPRTQGNPSQINQSGQEVLDDILTSPGSITRSGNRFGGDDIIAPDGRGARFDADGVFRGFLEPRGQR